MTNNCAALFDAHIRCRALAVAEPAIVAKRTFFTRYTLRDDTWLAGEAQVGVRAPSGNVVPCSIHGYAMWKPRDRETVPTVDRRRRVVPATVLLMHNQSALVHGSTRFEPIPTYRKLCRHHNRSTTPWFSTPQHRTNHCGIAGNSNFRKCLTF